MIFVTVGSQMPFDRLVSAVDAWAARAQRTDVFAQIASGGRRPTHIEWAEDLTPAEFHQRVESADLVVAHAGMGTILTALSLGKPLIIMPRKGSLRETRNDHQVATAERFASVPGVTIAVDEHKLAAILSGGEFTAGGTPISTSASPMLIQTLREFILQGEGTKP